MVTLHLNICWLLQNELGDLPGSLDSKESASGAAVPVRSLGREDPLEKEMANHSSILTWRIPWTEEPGRLQSMGSQRVGHDWVTNKDWIHDQFQRLWFFYSFLTRTSYVALCTSGRRHIMPGSLFLWCWWWHWWYIEDHCLNLLIRDFQNPFGIY